MLFKVKKGEVKKFAIENCKIVWTLVDWREIHVDWREIHVDWREMYMDDWREIYADDWREIYVGHWHEIKIDGWREMYVKLTWSVRQFWLIFHVNILDF